MPKYIEKAENQTLPLVVLRGVVTFPGMTVNCDIPTDSFRSGAAAQSAATVGENILLASLLDISEPDGGEPALTKLCPVGTVARIKQLIRTPDGETRLIAEGLCRATISSITPLDEHTIATVVAKTVVTQDDGGVEGEAYLREANFALRQVVRFIPAVAEDIMTHVSTIRNPGLYADFVAANILVRYEDKQAILECFDPMVRIDTLILIMRHEADVLSCESDIRKRVRERINRSQREYFLREEIKVIQDELGEGGSDTDEYFERIMGAELPAEVQKKLLRENERLAKLPFGSAEASVLTNYLDTCLEIPWKKTTTDRVNIEAARKVLDADHDGLEKVKERILEYMAVKQLSPDLKNQILCLVGPPGVGKTSIAASIARAMKRKYIRVSLGDVMKESAHAALTFTRSIASEYGIPSDFYRKKDIHIHVPEGAVPKDGPSAGVTMMTALVSALSGIPVRRDVAMTGEITLRGAVLPIGGLREKTMAAYAAGVKTVLIPADNTGDLEEIDPAARDNLTFIPCRRADEVLRVALTEPGLPLPF